MRNLSKYNDNYNYILTCIDVLSKYAWAVPVKRKKGDHVIEAFKTIFEEGVPKMLKTDHESEFINKKCQGLFKSHNISWFETFNETKA